MKKKLLAAIAASALLCGALCCYCCHTPLEFLSTWVSGPVFIPLLTLCLCALLVCEVPMFSVKLHPDGHHWSLAVVLGFLFYILNNLVYALFKL